MKHSLLSLLLSIFISEILFAQSSRTFRVKAGEDLALAYSPQGFYRFKNFMKGIVYYKDGKRSDGQLFNYNILAGNLQFVGTKNDTLNIGGQNNIDSVVLEKNIFLYIDGWMEVIARADSATLLKKIMLKTQVQNVGAYGVSNTTGSIDNINSYSTGTGVYSLILNQDVVLIENVSWFFKDANNTIMKANKASLLKSLSPAAQSKADAYFKDNKINFEKEADLKKLMQALQ